MSFCNIIVDKEDNIVILDPGGTHVDCRNRGWAGAVIYEGLNRLCAKGMVKAYTGSNQPFLLLYGIQSTTSFDIYGKNKFLYGFLDKLTVPLLYEIGV